MITCANCGSSYGGWKNFGFLELSDIVTIGADSHHFTVQKDNLLSFQRNYVEIGKDLLHGQYHSVKCISCAEVVGKKLFSCIVFDKEKLLYDSIQVKTSDTWVSKSRESPFDKLKVFELKDFKDAESITQQHLEPYVARRPSQRAESLLDRTSMNKKDHCQTKSTLLKGKNHYQKSTAFPQKCGFLKKNDINFAKPDRPKVGDSVNDMIQFLRSKKNVWDAGQIIYEFSSPNESNWKAITLRGITNDDSGKILHEIFSLLSLQEVRDGPNASVLYTPLSELTGLVGIMNYLRIGALREESVKQAMSLGRGGVQWLVIMDAALCAIQTVRYVLEKFVCVRSNAFMSSIIESFSRLIDTLVGDKFTETDTLDSWAPLLSAEDKCKSVGEAKNLALIMDGMKRMQKAADQARIQKSDAKNAEEKKREVKVASNRHRRGVSFLDDPARDNDYLKMNVTPTPDDLLCPPPELLPENHVEEELSTKSGQFDISQLSIAPKLPYRSNDHYLNTHFLLGFEDSVAQLRRGLQAFRDILAKDSGSTAIVPPTPPTPEKLKKACSSFCRSRDSGAYIYGDVSIDTVDCLRDGIGYVVSFSMYESRKVDWASSSRFMNGSLLCLSKDGTFNAKSIVVATVMRGVQAPKGQ